MKINKTAVAKLVTRTIVGSGTATIVKSIVNNNVECTNIYQKVTVGAATFVAGAMAANATKAHTDAMIDEIASSFQQITTPTPIVEDTLTEN